MNEEGREWRVLEALVDCKGVGQGFSVAHLARESGLTQRGVRHAITTLRLDGYAICAHPSTGYFLAQNQDELNKYCLEFLRSRAMHSLKLISGLTKTAMPDLIGQLNLET
jgi:biotin operon repressor